VQRLLLFHAPLQSFGNGKAYFHVELILFPGDIVRDFGMAMEKMVRGIPTSLWGVASDKLVDLVLNSTNGERMPSDLAKTILFYWQRDQLATEIGLQRLMEAAMILEPEKTIGVMDELGLHELVIMLRETVKV